MFGEKRFFLKEEKMIAPTMYPKVKGTTFQGERY
jgi:hypothetical protein